MKTSLRTALRVAASAIAVLVPRRLRPRVLSLAPGFSVHATSSIGRSFLCPSQSLIIGPHARVGSLTVARRLERLEMGAHSQIGSFNSITGWSRGRGDPYATPGRVPELVLEDRAAITNRHYVECSDSVRLAEGSVVGGLRTVIVTHSLNIASGDVCCSPVRIGRCSLVNTSCVIVGGSVLPDFSVLAPLSLLRRAHADRFRLYGGNPASAIRDLDPDAGVFRRLSGSADSW